MPEMARECKNKATSVSGRQDGCSNGFWGRDEARPKTAVTGRGPSEVSQLKHLFTQKGLLHPQDADGGPGLPDVARVDSWGSGLPGWPQ